MKAVWINRAGIPLPEGYTPDAELPSLAGLTGVVTRLLMRPELTRCQAPVAGRRAWPSRTSARPSRTSETSASASASASGSEPAAAIARSRRPAAAGTSPRTRDWRRSGAIGHPSRRAARRERTDAAAGRAGDAHLAAEVEEGLVPLVRPPGRGRGRRSRRTLARAPAWRSCRARRSGRRRRSRRSRRPCRARRRAAARARAARAGTRPAPPPPRAPVQVHRPAVVAQAAPRRDDVGRRRRGQRLDRRPALEPGQIARHDPRDLRLLQHHLRDEDRVRVVGAPPGQIARVLAVPSQKQLLHAEERSGRLGVR